jgi:hypothetical protein
VKATIIEKAMPIIYVEGSNYLKDIKTINGKEQTKDNVKEMV